MNHNGYRTLKCIFEWNVTKFLLDNGYSMFLTWLYKVRLGGIS